MVEIESALGKVSFEQQPHRTWTVEDESGFDIPPGAKAEPGSEMSAQEAIEKRRQFMEEAKKRQSTVSNQAKRRIEILLGVGRETKDVEAETPEGKIKYTLRTLKSKEQREIMSIVENAKRVRMDNGTYRMDFDSLYNLRIATLKHSLFMIDEIDIDVVLGSVAAPKEERIQYRVAFLEELDEVLIGRLFSAFESLMAENTAKYSVKTEEEAKEVAAEVKKSGQRA